MCENCKLKKKKKDENTPDMENGVPHIEKKDNFTFF